MAIQNMPSPASTIGPGEKVLSGFFAFLIFVEPLTLIYAMFGLGGIDLFTVLAASTLLLIGFAFAKIFWDVSMSGRYGRSRFLLAAALIFLFEISPVGSIRFFLYRLNEDYGITAAYQRYKYDDIHVSNIHDEPLLANTDSFPATKKIGVPMGIRISYDIDVPRDASNLRIDQIAVSPVLYTEESAKNGPFSLRRYEIHFTDPEGSAVDISRYSPRYPPLRKGTYHVTVDMVPKFYEDYSESDKDDPCLDKKSFEQTVRIPPSGKFTVSFESTKGVSFDVDPSHISTENSYDSKEFYENLSVNDPFLFCDEEDGSSENPSGNIPYHPSNSIGGSYGL